MSALSFVHAELRWQRYVLAPCSIGAVIAAAICMREKIWWAAAAYFAGVPYFGWIASSLHINKGKKFGNLFGSIPPTLQSAPVDSGLEQTTDEETHLLIVTMARTLYGLVLAFPLGLLVAGFRWYWAILAAFLTWCIGQMLGSVLVVTLSAPRTALRRIRRRGRE